MILEFKHAIDAKNKLPNDGSLVTVIAKTYAGQLIVQHGKVYILSNDPVLCLETDNGLNVFKLAEFKDLHWTYETVFL